MDWRNAGFGAREYRTVNSITHVLNPDGSITRKERKAKDIPKVSRKRSPTKGRTEWGWVRGEREICDLTRVAGQERYEAAKDAMWERDHGLCCICHKFVMRCEATFEHGNGRTAGKRDDRPTNENGVAHGECNSAKGSKRGWTR